MGVSKKGVWHHNRSFYVPLINTIEYLLELAPNPPSFSKTDAKFSDMSLSTTVLHPHYCRSDKGTGSHYFDHEHVHVLMCYLIKRFFLKFGKYMVGGTAPSA